MLIEPQPDIHLVGEAHDGREAIELADRLRPDLVLMDIRMPHLDGLQATGHIARLDRPPRVLILTTFDVDDYVFAAIRAGASGFLLKEAPPEEILAAIRLVTAGEALVAPASTRRLIERFAGAPAAAAAGKVDQLTSREREVLVLIARGMNNNEISQALQLTLATTKTHVAHILIKLGARDRVHAVVAAYECGLIRPAQG